MPVVLGLAGPAGPEKTRLRQGLTQALTQRGLRLGLVVQVADNPDPAPNLPCLEANAQGWRLLGPGAGLPSLDEMVARHFAGVDLVLCELHQDQRYLKIEFCPPGAAPSLLDDPGLRALVSAQPLEGKLPCFHPDDVDGLAAHLVDKVLPPPQQPLVRILADGHRLPAKDFVQEIVASTIRALVSTLRGAEEARHLEIHL
jgi:hypothetical protein